MVQMSVIEARLSQLGVHVSRLYKPEVKELQQILAENEEIYSIVPGRYFGGFALLAVTDRRLILIDKKTMFLTVEVIPFDMVSEVDFNARLVDASLVLFTLNKQHRFTCMKYKSKLRDMATYIQQKMMELRYSGQSGQAVAQSITAQPFQLAAAPVLVSEPEPMIVPLEPHHHFAPVSVAHAPAKIKQLVGAAALHGTPLSRINPYTKTSFMMRKQYSRFS